MASQQTIYVVKWSKQAFVKAKGQHFEHSLFMISCIVWTDEMFQSTLIISEDRKKLDCRTYAVDERALFFNDAVVAIGTTQVVLDQYQAF